MTEDKFIYLITDKDGKFFYEEDGLVQTQGQFRELQHAPDGFQDQSIEYKRDSTWHGVFRNFSFPLGFVLDAKNILNHIRYKLGYEFRAFLHILIQDFFINDTEYGFGYKKYYRGEFDLTTVKKSENKIEVSLLDGGVEAMLRANENTQYTIPFDQKDFCILHNDGINLKNTVQYVITDGYSTITDNYPYNKNHLVDLQEVSREVAGIPSVKSVDRTKVVNNNAEIKKTQQWFFKATTPGIVTIDYDFILKRSNIDIPTNIGIFAYVTIRNIHEDGATTGDIIFQTTEPWNLFGSDRVQGSVEVNVNKGDELYLYTSCNASGASGEDNINFQYSGEGLFKVTYLYRHESTFIVGYQPAPLFKKLVEKMTDGKYETDTTFLEKKKQYFITSGDAIRRIDDAKLKLSFSDFWQWLWANEDIYLGIKTVNGKKVVTIDELRFQYQQPISLPTYSLVPVESPIRDPRGPNRGYSLYDITKATNLGVVRNVEVETYRDVLFNRIKVGCQNQNYEDPNGRAEFNSTQHWSAPVVRDTKVLDLSTGNVREDAIGVEYARINFEGKYTTDASSDNETFAMYIQPTPFNVLFDVNVYRLDRSESITGVIDPVSHYNAFLSPKHKLLRKSRYLRSCLYGLEGSLKLTQAEKNADVSFDGAAENADLPIASMGEPYFTPDLIKFETPYPLNLIELQNSEELRRNCFRIVFNEKEHFGFLHTVSIQPWMNEVQTLALISSPKNDLSTI